MRNFTAIDNDVKRVFFDPENDLDYGDLAMYVYIAMHIRVKDGELKGLAYPTKRRMQADLSIGKQRLTKSIDKLVDHGFIATKEVANKYGGKPLLYYRLADEWKDAEQPETGEEMRSVIDWL